MIGFAERLLGGALTALHFHLMRFYRHYLTIVVINVLGALVFGWLMAAPMTLAPATVAITSGESADMVAANLADEGVVRAAFPLWLLLRVTGGDSRLQSGTYRFSEPESVLSVMRRILTGDYGLPRVKVTVVEGATIREIAALVHASIPSISAAEVIAAANGEEGYLFPDTYFLSATSDAKGVVKMMRDNFDIRIADVLGDVRASGHTLGDVITMASLIEKEARTEENRRLVAGVLWNRIKADMPLQVDAVFGYIFDRPTYSPSAADLKVDSPYNTYTHKGLPPGPINSPGLDAIDAVLHPTPSKYLYYLTGKDDAMHYATTFAGHQANLDKYVR